MEYYASLRPPAPSPSPDFTIPDSPRPRPPPPGFNPYPALTSADTGLEERLLNMTVHHSSGEQASGRPYPERPDQPDCVYYMRNGTCNYGVNCRYNHPSVNKSPPASDKEFPERPGQPECQFYMKTGTCKFGILCKYHHPQKKAEPISGQAQLNFLGLPIRPGEKECPYYLLTGSCKYGASCKYHHPQPTAVGTVSAPVSPVYSSTAPASPLPVHYQAGPPSRPVGPVSKPAFPLYSSTAPVSPVPVPYQAGPLSRPTAAGPVSKGASPLYPSIAPVSPVAVPYQAGPPSRPTAVGTASKASPLLFSSTAPASRVHVPYQAGPPSRPTTSGPFMPQGPLTYVPGFVPPQSTSMPGWNSYHGPVSQLPSHAQQQAMGRAFVYGTAQQVDANAGGMPWGRAPAGSTSSTLHSSVIQGDFKFPERPGQRDCSHFLKTGECKFGANCKYHHPKARTSASVPLTFNPLGLPLRPGQPPCTFYSNHGICKFGPTCKFDHPGGPPYNSSTSTLGGVSVVPCLSGALASTLSHVSLERSSETFKSEELIPATQVKSNLQSVANGDSEQIPTERVAESTMV